MDDKTREEYEKKKLPFTVLTERHVNKGKIVNKNDIIYLSPAKGARQEEQGNVRSATPQEIKDYEDLMSKRLAMVPKGANTGESE